MSSHTTGVKAVLSRDLAQFRVWRGQVFMVVFMEKVTPELLPKGRGEISHVKMQRRLFHGESTA